MTRPPTLRQRAPEMLLVAAMVLLSAAATVTVLFDRERSLAAAGPVAATLANAADLYLRLSLEGTMRRLDALAAAAEGDFREPQPLEAPARLALAGLPEGRYAAVFDAGGKRLAAAGPPEAAPAEALTTAALARLAGPRAPGWYVTGAREVLLARRVSAPDGGFGGIAVLATGVDWMDRLVAGAGLGGAGGLLLLDADGRIIRQAPADNRPAALVERRGGLPGHLELAVARNEEEGLEPWNRRSTATLVVLACVQVLLAAGWAGIRERNRRLLTANHRHLRQLAQLATAAELLSRLRDVEAITARAEAVGPTLLPCDSLRVVLDPPAGQDAAGPEPAGEYLSLLSTGGERLGRIVLTGGTVTAADALVGEQFARAVASALEGATLLADTMGAKSELELILSTITDGMFVLDCGWCVRYANAAAARYLQCPREAMLGADVWTLLPGLRDGDLGARLQAACDRRQDAAFTSFYPPLHAWYEMRAYPFAGGLTVYFRDVTLQRETEEKLRQAQKLEAVGQLTGGIAHDVNNLLTVILGNLELLAMRAGARRNGGAALAAAAGEEEPALDLSLAEAALRAGESASQLMHRLLAFSRRQPLSPQAVAVGTLLQTLQPLIRRTMSEQVNLQMRWPAGLGHALVDPAELESAVLNLAINALDAMPGGGTLTIEAANVAVDRVYAAVAGLDRTGDHIMISVADTGSGMPKEVMARAFDPFFTTKGPGRGSGLGLSMVYGFVRQSGGHVLLDSEPGRGTIVRLYLPRTLPGEAVAPAPWRGGVAGGNENILLVEDNELVRSHTEAMLRGLGYQVTAVADGPAALRALAEGRRPDLLLTDVILPGGMTGRDVAEAAQRALPGLPVLFISGYSGDVLLENGRLPPGVDLLGKPFRRSELAARIRARLAAGAAGPG